MRDKQYLAAIRPAGDVLTLETMLFADELVSPDQLEELPDKKEIKATKKEVEMAQQLIESLTNDFDPTRYEDTYRERVLDLIERKAEGEEIATQPEPEEQSRRCPDLMAALEASIADAKKTAKPAAKSAGRKPAKGAAAKKPAAKKPRPSKPAVKKTPAKRKTSSGKAKAKTRS